MSRRDAVVVEGAPEEPPHVVHRLRAELALLAREEQVDLARRDVLEPKPPKVLRADEMLSDRRDRRLVGGRVAEKVVDPPLEEIVDRAEIVRDRRRLQPEQPALVLPLLLAGEALRLCLRGGRRGEAATAAGGVAHLQVPGVPLEEDRRDGYFSSAF
jgi:hypothetical protein